jgi:hypothetical protein
MRKARLAVLIVGVIIILDVVLANIPGPVPTSQAISNVKSSASVEAIVGNGTYSYIGYSDDPSWDLQCTGNLFRNALHFFDPFHEYTTTTLMISVQPSIPHGFVGELPANEVPFIILAQVNPTSGEIYNIQTQEICV